MVEPFLELLVNAADIAATVVVLLALWEGRSPRGRDLIARWLGTRTAAGVGDVERFLRVARAFGARKKTREARPEPSAGGPPPRLPRLS